MEIGLEHFSKAMHEKVDKVLCQLYQNIPASSKFKTFTDAQGTGYLLRNRHWINSANVQLTGDGEDCNKDTGNKVRLRRCSRGVVAIVRGGGHIECFAPLYRSESPTQVATFALRFLIETLGKIEPDKWKEIFFGYDNMCNLGKPSKVIFFIWNP